MSSKKSTSLKRRPTTVVVSYVEHGLENRYVIPRNFTHSILRRRNRKNSGRLNTQSSQAVVIGETGLPPSKESIFGSEIVTLIRRDDDILNKLNPVKEVHLEGSVGEKGESDSSLVKPESRFHLRMMKENVFNFRVYRVHPIEQYTLQRVLDFPEFQDLVHFLGEVRFHDGLYVRYYDKFHKGYTRITDYNKIPLTRTGRTKIRVLMNLSLRREEMNSIGVEEEEEENYDDSDGFVVIGRKTIDRVLLLDDNNKDMGNYFFSNGVDLGRAKSKHFIFIEMLSKKGDKPEDYGKKWVRGGIPDNLRGEQWYNIIVEGKQNQDGRVRSVDDLNRDYWNTFAKSFSHFNQQDGGEIDPRIFPEFGGQLEKEDLILNDTGYRRYKRLCVVLSTKNHSIEYTPCLPYILQYLLLYMEDERKVFSIAQRMVELSQGERSNSRHWYYFRMNKMQFYLFLETFYTLVEQKYPSVTDHFDRLHFDLSTITQIWFSKMFYGSLPLNIALRIFDSYVLDGEKILYRAGLSLIRVAKKKILECKEKENMIRTIQDVVGRVTSISAFFKLSFGFRLKREKFKKYDKENRETFDYSKLSGSRMGRKHIKPKIDDSNPSKIVTGQGHMRIWELLLSWVPEAYRVKTVTKIYSSDRDGYSLAQLLTKSSGNDVFQSLLLIHAVPIEDVDDERFVVEKKKKSIRGFANRKKKKVIFGAFIDTELKVNYRFYGGNDTFLFTLVPHEEVFYSKAVNNYYVKVEENKKFTLGAGGDGAGLTFDASIRFGYSYQCETFGNKPLADRSVRFEILQAELFAFL